MKCRPQCSVKLNFLDGENAERRKIANRYCAEITHPELILPQVGNEESHVWHLL